MPAKKPILVLDVMDTLVTDPFFTSIPGFFGLTMDELMRQKHPDSWIRFEEGKLTEDEYFAAFFQDGRSIDQRAFRQMLWANYEWLPGVEILVAELNAAGYAMHALSNYSVWYRIIEEKLKLSRFLEWTFVSTRTGLRKPAEACYRLVGDELGVELRDCLFVDDREVNVEGAKRAGMDAVRMQGADELRSSLCDRGLEF